MTIELIEADWPAPAKVRAGTTTRSGGVSLGGFESLNLADHVQDDPQAVAENRQRLVDQLRLPGEPFWLTQVHGCQIALGDQDRRGCQADGAYTKSSSKVCVVLTADCLPLLLTDIDGREVCAVHAGWRGLASGIIEQAVAKMSAPAESMLVWLGPAIGPAAFEVGDEVRDVFVKQAAEDSSAFITGRPGHWWADIYQLARLRLQRMGVGFISGGDYCTVADCERFFSYRRDGMTGRMASLIWLEPRKIS